MGTQTFLEIQNEVLSNVENRQDVTTVNIKRWVNRAYLHMTHPSVHRFKEIQKTLDITLVSGQGSYDISAATLGFQILGFRSLAYYPVAAASIVPATVGQILREMKVEVYDQRPHPAGRPTHYVTGEDDTLLFSNTPNDTNTVRCRYYRQIAILSGDTNVTVLPAYYDAALVMGAQAFTEFALGMREKSSETFVLYSSLLNGAETADVLQAQNLGHMARLTNPARMETS